MRDCRKRWIALCGLMAMLASIVVGVTPSPASAANLCAEPNGVAGCFTTIQEAVDNASAGDNILVRRGTYFENVVIPAGLDGLTIRNQGSTRQIILDPDTPNTGVGITIEADDVTVRGLTIRNGESLGIHITGDASGALVDRMSIGGTNGDCVLVDGPDATVKNSTLFGCGSDGVEGNPGATGLTIERNKINNCDADCINVDADGVTVKSNIIRTADDGAGIELTGDQMVVRSNRVSRTDDDSYRLRCESCTGGLVQANISDFASDDDGFSLYADAPGLVVKQNKSFYNGNEGFRVEGVGIKLERNLSVGNGGDNGEHGFQISGSDHELIRNTARDNHGDGFAIGGDGFSSLTSAITLDRNLAINNIEDGFDVESAADASLTRNRAINNLGVGFEISATAVDTFLANNTGTRNRTDFCDEGTGTLLGANKFGTTGACVIDG